MIASTPLSTPSRSAEDHPRAALHPRQFYIRAHALAKQARDRIELSALRYRECGMRAYCVGIGQIPTTRAVSGMNFLNHFRGPRWLI